MFESQWGWDSLHPSRTALEPTQPPVPCVLGLFPGVNATGRGVDLSPPSSAKVIEKELYFYSLWGPTWPAVGWTLLLGKVILQVKITSLTSVAWMCEAKKNLHTKSWPRIRKWLQIIWRNSHKQSSLKLTNVMTQPIAQQYSIPILCPFSKCGNSNFSVPSRNNIWRCYITNEHKHYYPLKTICSML